jgi:hypothetical protein
MKNWLKNIETQKLYLFLSDGQVEVPCGQPVETTSNKSSGTRTVSPSLLYNEYIVYDVGQIRERFLVEFDFDHGFEL